MRKMAAVLILLALAFWCGAKWGKSQSKRVPVALSAQSAFRSDSAKIYLNGRFFHILSRCKINWLDAHPSRTLPSESSDACTDEDLERWNKNMDATAESQ